MIEQALSKDNKDTFGQLVGQDALGQTSLGSSDGSGIEWEWGDADGMGVGEVGGKILVAGKLGGHHQVLLGHIALMAANERR